MSPTTSLTEEAWERLLDKVVEKALIVKPVSEAKHHIRQQLEMAFGKHSIINQQPGTTPGDDAIVS